MLTFEIALDPHSEPDLAAIPNVAGVYVIWPREGRPHIGKTAVLRRRLTRLLRPAEKQSRLLNLSAIAARLEYQPTGSPFESAWMLYHLARRYRPDDYRKFLKLRPPPFLKLNLSNPYPRCYITRRLGGDKALYFGPFTTRAAAELFQNAFLDLFQIRRCVEDLEPHAGHPGCIYGEMNMCLRPCQTVVTIEQYREEADRVAQFLSSKGESLLGHLGAERERLSAGLEFEQAARIHKKLEKVHEALKQSEDLARDLNRLYGVIVQASMEPGAIELWFLYQGFLQERQRLTFATAEGQPFSLDQKLRDLVAAMRFERHSKRDCAEHLALLVRWHRSSWRKGELLLFDGPDRLPYRKLVKAISRVAEKK